MNGDGDGPFEGECVDFHYENCSSSRCDQYTTCNVCISDTQCGWCEGGDYCFNSNRFDNKDCAAEDYYHVENEVTCPESHITEPGDAPVTTYDAEIESLYSQRSALEAQIEELDSLRIDLVQQANEVVRVGGVKYTIKDGVVYDAKQLLEDVKEMVKKAKSEEKYEMKQPGMKD